MVEKIKKTSTKVKLDKLLQMGLNVALAVLAIVLCVLLAKEAYHLVHLAIFEESKDVHYQLLESILAFFLYFEFIAMIVKYYEENYHFPLRYFMYIGITAMIRLIVLDHDDALQTLYFTGAILVLVISFFILNVLSLIKAKHGK